MLRTTCHKTILGAGLAMALGACAGSFKNTLNFNPSEPIRVAVLPFYQVDKQGQPVQSDADLLVDQVGVVSSELGETPAMFLRKLVLNELSDTSLDVLSPALVDSRLSHSGFSNTDLSLNLSKIAATPAKDFCPKVLDCDAVLIGKITDWDRQYFALQTISSVGLDLSLISVTDGKLLFSSQASDSDSRGLSKGPTGFSSLVVEPIKGLDNQIIQDLARSMVAKVIAPLKVRNRPEFLETPPPAIFASAHDAIDGKIEGHLTVVMLGNMGMTAWFGLGNKQIVAPMSEREPGHYVGEFHPVPGDTIRDQPVTVFLTDKFGRTSSQRIGARTVTLVQNESQAPKSKGRL